MAGYNRNSVSVLIVNMKKGEELIRNIDTKEFSIQEVDADTTKCTSGAEKRFRIMINMGTLRQAYSPVIIAEHDGKSNSGGCNINAFGVMMLAAGIIYVRTRRTKRM